MPIYEWQCGEGHVFEMLVAAGASKRGQRCPVCGAKSKPVISTFAIHGGAPISTAFERAAARDTDVTRLEAAELRAAVRNGRLLGNAARRA